MRGRLRRKSGSSGFTLVELMVVVGIAGFLSLAIMQMLFDVTKVNHQMRLQAEVSRDLEEFAYALEQYVGQTTQVVSCACNPGGPNCQNVDLQTEAAAPDGAQVVVFRFVAEDAADPLLRPTANCIFFPNTLPGGNVLPLGCKKVFELRYTPPTNVAGAVPSNPGRLEIADTTNGANTVLHSLRAVTRFGCGMSPNPNGTLSNLDLRLRIEVKARQFNWEDTARGDYESWAPGGANFAAGIRRTHIGQIVFRNLAVYGVQFGKVRGYRGCVRDGDDSADPNQCCSGWYGAGTKCACSPAAVLAGACGGAIPCMAAGGAPGAGDPNNCCSKSVSPGGVCI